MNERFDFLINPESRTLDRLVDGELSLAERRVLFSAIEAQPDGWRRCAMAFLEAQAWKDDIAMLVPAELSRINGAPTTHVGESLRVHDLSVAHNHPTADAFRKSESQVAFAGNHSTIWPRILATAATVGLAFFLGVAVRGYWSVAPNQPTSGAVVDNHSLANANSTQTLNQKSSSSDGVAAPASLMPTITMTVVNKNGDGEQQFEIPVVEADRLDAGWLASRPAAIPPQAVEELRRRGYRIDEQRLLVPVVLDDGRRAILPFDQAEITYAGMQF
jgi:hypothetical protein